MEKENVKTTVSKNKKGYGYKYTDLAQIHEYLESINAKYIQIIKRIEGEDYIFTKRCFDNKWEDEWLQGSKVVDAVLSGIKNPAQEQGSALTYARRYSLLMAFGLATEDDDAQSLSKEKKENKIVSKATDKQLEYIKNLEVDLVGLCNYYEIDKLEDLTVEQASEVIKLKGKK